MKYSWFLLLCMPLVAADTAAPHRYIVELTGEPVGVHVSNESKRTAGHRRSAWDSDVAETRRQQLRDEQKQAPDPRSKPWAARCSTAPKPSPTL